MTNIFSVVQKNAFTKKFLSWFLMLSVVFQTAALPLTARAENSVNNNKIEICHIPLGFPENAHTVEVDENSAEMSEHLGHGDTLGACNTLPPPSPAPAPAPTPQPITIIASKIVCDDEAKLPNWGLGGPDVTSTTAADYAAAHPGCALTRDWKFQWGFGPKSGDFGVNDFPGDFIGEANGASALGLATGGGYNEWKTFGPTTPNGVAVTQITDLSGASNIWVREVLQDGYIPFTFDDAHQSNANNVSAEMYCATDVLNYDNVDSIGQPEYGTTYYCVAFNAKKTVTLPPPPPPSSHCSDGIDNDQDGTIDYPHDLGCDSVTDNDENNKPVITVITPNPTIILLGSIFVDLGANATDAEDCISLNQTACNSALQLTAAGTVNTAVLGTTTITYNATDSQGLAADPKTRTVVVGMAPGSACKAPTDTLLLIDRSGSMTFDGTNPAQPLGQAKAAANTFIDTLSTSTDQVGIVSYNLVATLNQTLTNNFSSAKSSYASLTATGGTDIGLAIERATTEFTQNGRVGAKHVIILLSDGIPDVPGKTPAQSAASAIQKATVAKSAGIVIYTIGLGNGVNPTLMTQIASLSANYYFAPSGTVLESIYRNISEIECQRNPALISGKKINDANGNGIVDGGETGIADWEITLTAIGGSQITPRTEETNSSGEYTFGDVLPGTYNLCEVNKSGWFETYPATSTNNGCYLVTISEGDHVTGKNFLNKESLKPQCSDGIDNDQDGTIDYPHDLGCDSVTDNDENNKPIITVVAPNPTIILLGSVFADLGANATDIEDCIGLTQAACNSALHLTATGTVNTSVLGTSTITYTAIDSKGLNADPKTRTVVVQAMPPQCSDGLDNDQDGEIDFVGGDTGCDTPTDNSENAPPVITLIGSASVDVFINTTFTELGANATDTEDCVTLNQTACNTALHLNATGTVNTSVLGVYTITYNATDSQSLAAVPVSRTVHVLPTQGCTVNCGGGGGSDNTRPVITLLGGTPLDVIIGTTFTDPGATAADPEDGNITPNIVVTGGPVTTATIGTFTLSYNVSDSKGLAALEVRRDVRIIQAPTVGCVTNCGGGGGGGGPIPLSIFNERIVTTGTTTVTITWNTNQPADSRVVYGLEHVASLGNAPQYGYPLSTVTDTTLTTNHSMVISGIPSALATYFRPLSSDGARKVVGIELTHAPVVSIPQECFYLREYMRLGANNNPAEVIKLQSFLRNNEGFTTLPVTGFFDIETDRAVRTFQDRYKTDVLDFWNLPANTGYVYFTTQKKVNELYCKREFPLNATQMDEIIEFRDLIKRVNAINAQGGVAQVLPLVGINLPLNNDGSIAGASAVQGGEIASGASVVVATPTRAGNQGFTLGELLAISPNLGGLSGTETAVRTPNLEVAAVGVLPEKKGFSFGSLFSSIIAYIVGIFK